MSAKLDLNRILELQAQGYNATHVADLMGANAKVVGKLARRAGSPFPRNGERRKMPYRCMDCKTERVEGRWQRCSHCRSIVSEMGSWIGEHTLRMG